MDLLISHVIVSAIVGGACLWAGWWFRSRVPEKQSLVAQNNEQLIKDLMTSLHGLSTRMAADVDVHSTEIDAVDRELTQTPNQNGSKVAELVDRLIRANQSVQSKLAETEGKLDDLSKKMECHATEARTDVLTGLRNRRAFQEEYTSCQADFRQTQQRFSLVMMDIDRFKQVNDVHGHPLGDEVLRGVGAVLKDNMRGRDIVSRYGGEEFAALMPNTNITEALRIAETAREVVEKARFEFGDLSLNITISLGVAEIQSPEGMPELIKRADEAMYAAKNAGRNRTYWHDGSSPRPIESSSEDAADDYREEPAGGAKAGFPRVSEESVEATDSCTSATEGVAHDESSDDCVRSGDIDMNVLNNMGNKTMFCQNVHRRISEFGRGGSPFSVILLRADGGDDIAQAHGKSVGKILLGVVAEAIRRHLREVDLVARYNDLTFGMVLPDASLRNAVCIGERLRKAIKDTTVAVDGKPLRFTVSLGIVEVADSDVMATMVERARAQLEQAQSSGGNRTGFSASELVAS